MVSKPFKYIANQVIRAITILSLSAYLGVLDIKSLCMIIGMPAVSAGLKFAGISETASQLLPMAAVISTQILTDLPNAAKTAVTIMSAATSGWVGNQVAQLGLVRNSVFAIKTQIEKLYTLENSNDLKPKYS